MLRSESFLDILLTTHGIYFVIHKHLNKLLNVHSRTIHNQCAILTLVVHLLCMPCNDVWICLHSTPTLHDNMCYVDTDTRSIVKYTSFSCDTHLLNKSSEVLLDACTHEISAATSFLLTEVG